MFLVFAASCGFPEPADVTGPPDAPSQEACCQLLASRPALAKAGATLTLEGTFDPGGASTILFPGGETAPLTLLGPHRARVVVPASATGGELTMMFEGAVVGTAPFRRISFTPTFARFETKDHQAAGARQDTSLAQLRSGATATVVGRWLYVIGGADAGAARNTVERAAMYPDGTLGRFAIVPAVTLTTARSRHQAVTIGGFLYVIGGSDGTSSIASIERAPITDGTLGPFETVADVVLTTARAEMTSAVIGNWLYVVGGTDGSQPLDTIERAYFASDGSVGTFELVADVTLKTARKGHTSLVTLDGLYVFAGSGGQPLDTIEKLPISPDGDLGAAMVPSAANTLVARDRAVGVELEDQFCLFGGAGLTAECATIASDGNLGPFISPSSNTMLRTPRVGPVAAVVANNLFLIGGDGATSIERTSLMRGVIGAFTTATSQTTTMPSGGMTATVVGDNVYVLGADDHERARVALDGALGTFGPAPRLVMGTGMHSTAVIGDYLYVLGGFTYGPTQALTRVERAVIKPDGSLDPFAAVTGVTLAKRRYGHTSVVVGNNLYVIGGVSISGTGINEMSKFEGTIERATINADGSISTFAPVPGVTFTPRSNAATVVIKDSIYIIGGKSSPSTGLTNVEHIEFNPDGTLKVSTYVDLPLATGLISPTLSIMGGYLYAFGGDAEFPAPDNRIQRATISSDGQVSGFATIPPMLPADRNGATALVLGNQLYLLNGAADRSVVQAELQ